MNQVTNQVSPQNNLKALRDSDRSRLRHDVFLFHFGGPTKSEEVQPFLEKLFHDPFILRIPIPQRLRLALGSYIARKRAEKTDAQYAKIGYSPINRYTEYQARKLEELLRAAKPQTDVHVHVINRYTAPFAKDVLRGCEFRRSRIYLTTLYPHFSHSTAGSSLRDFDVAWQEHQLPENIPMTRVFSWWHHKSYMKFFVDEVFTTIMRAHQKYPHEKLTLLFSAHGLPKKYAERGDPYPHDIRAHAHETMSQISKDGRLSQFSSDIEWSICYQSRVGPVEWLRPYTEDSIEEWGRNRGGVLILIPISFVSDHIETLYEMDMTYRDLALQSGFKDYIRMPMPNEDDRLAGCLRDILLDYGF